VYLESSDSMKLTYALSLLDIAAARDTASTIGF